MIKVFLSLVIARLVLSAPGVPFVNYGLPEESNDNEQSLPLIELQIPNEEASSFANVALENQPSKNLPESIKNPEDKNELPESLLDTTKVENKLIPDIDEVAVPSEDLELPKYEYIDGSWFVLPDKVNKLDDLNSGLDFVGVPKTEIDETVIAGPLPSEDEEEVGPSSSNIESKIKETEVKSNANTPSGVTLPLEADSQPLSTDDELPSIVSIPSIETSQNSEASDIIAIPTGTRIKVQDKSGQYSHGFANPDGTQVQESGHLISTDDGWEYVIAKEGSYSYISPEGIPIHVQYVADHNGYRIIGQKFAGR